MVNINGITNADSSEVSVFDSIYNTKYESLMETNAYYWIPPSGGSYSLYCKLNHNRMESSGSSWFQLGIRVLVKISPAISISEENTTKTITSKRGIDYTYNVWDIEY